VACSKITIQQLQQEIDYLQKEIEKRDLEKVSTPEEWDEVSITQKEERYAIFTFYQQPTCLIIFTVCDISPTHDAVVIDLTVDDNVN
jgi:hypothetical protein